MVDQADMAAGLIQLQYAAMLYAKSLGGDVNGP